MSYINWKRQGKHSVKGHFSFFFFFFPGVIKKLSGANVKESALVVENPPGNAEAGDSGLIPGSGSSPGGRHGNHSIILAGKIPWTEKPGGLQSMGSQRVGQET